MLRHNVVFIAYNKREMKHSCYNTQDYCKGNMCNI